MKKRFSIILWTILASTMVFAGCGNSSTTTGTSSKASSQSSASSTTKEVSTTLSKIDMTKWQYNSDDKVYYQIGISYCSNPSNESYEKLAVFVPADYFEATDNGDGTYTCSLKSDATVGSYTAATAPIVMPINTPGYSAQKALSDYTDVSDYTDQGFIYVHAGCRGRDDGAPAGVTDLKAAIRYIRYNSGVIAGDTESIFTFGMSGGGAQSAIVGATGDSELYNDYLTAIGAVEGVSDAVAGSMCWCPITNLDTADASYEWMMGTTRSGLSDEEQQISDKPAEAYAEYVNKSGFKDESGNALNLTASNSGIYQSGTYYDYIKSVIETSLNHFLSDTTFPYDASSSGSKGGMGGGMPSGEKPDGAPDGERPDGAPGSDSSDSGSSSKIEDVDNVTRNNTSSDLSLSGTYETIQDYIDALNANGEWVTYDSSSQKATVTSVEAFVNALKTASKNLGAFDQFDSGQAENTLFGYTDGNGAHFDSALASILKKLGSDYASAYESDLEKTDSAGKTAEERVNMYTPLYYLLQSEKGYGTSTVAKYWRIRTGINQSDTALTTEVNLALALENCDSVKDVDFETVWGQGHTEAERTGNSTENFIAWVNACMANQD